MSEITIMIPDEVTKNMSKMRIKFEIGMKPELPPILLGYRDTDSAKEESEEN